MLIFYRNNNKMQTSDYVNYEKMLRDIFSKQLENKEIDYSYYENEHSKKDYDKFINTLTYLDSFYFKFETTYCSVKSDMIAEIVLFFDYEDEEDMYSLDLTLNLDEEWISEFKFC